MSNTTTFTVTKLQNKTSTSWQYDVKDSRFNSGKKRKYGFKTKAKATNVAQQLIRDCEDGNKIEDNKKFETYYNDWLEIKETYLPVKIIGMNDHLNYSMNILEKKCY